MSDPIVLLCPGQGAQAIGMGKAWAEHSAAARAVFDAADAFLGDSLGSPLSSICFDGPEERINQTDVSQPALYTCGVACWAAMQEASPELRPAVVAGLSLGEYTALHLAGAMDFEVGLSLVATRGRLMQEAADAINSSMVALIGADEEQARAVCAEAADGEVLVPANFNAPGQIVISGTTGACDRALGVAEAKGLRATRLAVAGAFHSPLMQPAADRMAEALAEAALRSPSVPVFSNVTAVEHDPNDLELLKQRLVEQIVSPVLWAQTCQALAALGSSGGYHELAPGSVLRGLMRRTDRSIKVQSHDQP